MVAKTTSAQPSAPPPSDPGKDVLTLLKPFLDAQGGDWDIHDVALKFRQTLENDHSTLWSDYADHHWAAHFEGLIHRCLNEVRAAARQNANRSVAHKRVNEKKTTGMATTTYAVERNGRYKKLMEMTKVDLLNVAERYETTAATSLKQASFLRVVAKKIKSNNAKVSSAWSAVNIEKAAREIFGTEAEDVLGDIEGQA